MQPPAAAVLAAVVDAQRARRPLFRGPALADAVRLDDPTCRRAVNELQAARLVYPPDALVFARPTLDIDDLLPLDLDPARPSAEWDRFYRERELVRELQRRVAMGFVVFDAYLPDSVGGFLRPAARRETLARLRDPSRRGGAVLQPFGAVLATPAGEAAREAL